MQISNCFIVSNAYSYVYTFQMGVSLRNILFVINTSLYWLTDIIYNLHYTPGVLQKYDRHSTVVSSIWKRKFPFFVLDMDPPIKHGQYIPVLTHIYECVFSRSTVGCIIEIRLRQAFNYRLIFHKLYYSTETTATYMFDAKVTNRAY